MPLSMRAEPAGHRIAQLAEERDLADAMHLRHAEDIQGIECGDIAAGDMAVGIDEFEYAAQVGTPTGRHAEDIGGKAVLACGAIVMRRQKVAGPVEGRLSIRKGDGCHSRYCAD